MSASFTAVDVVDLRFPTSQHLDGSDAMNPDPDYSATYVVVRTDAGDGLEGHGFTFTIGRGNEIRDAVSEGWTHVKMKVGRDHGDLRRAAILREEFGDDRFLLMDANQVWTSISEAVD